MCDQTSSNPFTALLFPIDVVQSEAKSAEPEDFASSEKEPASKSYIEEDLLAEVFGLTLKSQPGRHKECLVYIEADSAEEAVFDRLILEDVESRLVGDNANTPIDSHTTEKEIIPYLFESFCRLRKRRADQSAVEEEMRENFTIGTLRNVSTVLQAPDIFPGQEVHMQFISLFEDSGCSSEDLTSFVSGILKELDKANERDSDDDIVATTFTPILDWVQKTAASRNLLTTCHSWFNLLQKFASFKTLAMLILSHSTPKRESGRAYMDTLLGTLFSFTSLPNDVSNTLIDLFDGPLEQRKLAFEGAVWSALDALGDSLHRIFHALLKCSPEVRHLTLKWLGDCLKANASHGKLWNMQNLVISNTTTVSDGFMLNLCSVLLRLCQPFCTNIKDRKILQIDPTYCVAEAKDEEDSRKRGLHMHGLSKETCLVPIAADETRPTSENFGFVTECFFLTHYALDIGYRVVFGKLTRANHELARVFRMFDEVRNTNVQPMAINVVDSEFMKYISIHASLNSPETLNLLAKFHAATAYWLVQVNIDLDDDASSVEETSISRKDYTLRKMRKVTFPLPDRVPDTIKCIPEFVVENMIEFVCFLARSAPDVFEKQGSSFLGLILTEILALMGSPERLYNPHLRARLAKALQALSPTNNDKEIHPQVTHGTHNRRLLFTLHEHRDQIVPTLLHVFVSIEMTGQSVQFEQKFNYRRPMNIILNYLLGIPVHKDVAKKLADEAEANMEAMQPPLFLRFINLLINDAVFLLEDALANMAQLRRMIQARESGEWERMPAEERNQQTTEFHRFGMIARFDNILGRETIHTLKMLTKETKSIFCHATMVDRIASMLNYLLVQLVGPKKRNLKVKDRTEYEFEPGTLVLNICEIYINLSDNENFTLAVSQDGRSYTPNLFNLAEDVLVRVGGGAILGDLANFAERVKSAANVKKEEDELLNMAPDEYLDPIMSTLMRDPVILPSSKVTIDRQTIARHLLSDQTDPFNRSPLTMDMVKSNTELCAEIEEWIKQKMVERSSSSSSNADH